ncbi:serine/threonine protein kinase HT1, putative [Entamoeba invadens IP1]|uniref:Serine/threonine protein kinase HT1, putative n=1 Tax=Entamoeba invadens IP1 TaxID=370355 RepID=A0A0A1U9K5_ENTIV|nr:serine/threonine protein kinase HT1, putative [Entamoeba invadens IP1]ELP91537.1 serine/threonine protein kinase HT1, putative [Entamoeba invadens IP1]|eukprot:XP_004258308.1 serine/threonine protein kinase HT1, putative [Entamoeba invadens IP1]
MICVGNELKNVIKVQFTILTNIDKFIFKAEPEVVLIKRGYACEFSLCLTPLCTCKINTTIQIISKNLKTEEENYNTITINAVTSQSTRLDYDELIEENKLGEGSFGIVYKGMYRENVVAIKKMKQINNSDEKKSIDEFEKEVAMLDKFRCDYIVHFYGAVFIPNKMCMVTEFAQFGSLQDLIKHKRSDEIETKLRVKMLLDASKGISYLHENGILHRDIKPDNILVLSLDVNEKVNAKLTDFGSARNVNLLMTNMTFTKGVGTPVYMAPEILKQEKYTKSADIFSFGVTMFEVVGWSEAYQKDRFKYPWKIAEFVMSGKRLERKEKMPIPLYDVIQTCWVQYPKERISIEKVIENLEELNH